MQSWAAEELKYANLPDVRLNKRLVKIVENLAAQPNTTVPQASGDWANTKATYNFWKSERIGFEDIIDAHQRSAIERASAHNLILAVQDTTDLNFTHHKSKNWEGGFGQISPQEYVRGLKVHSVLGVSERGSAIGSARPTSVDQRAKKQGQKQRKK
ncbi:MAG: transposase DNA-binding-containing protein [Xenococcaceae cyanobacterium]